MTNLLLYKRVNQLKDFLENHELEEYPKAKLERAEDHIIEVFKILERRKNKSK